MNQSPIVLALETHIRALGLPEPEMEHRFLMPRRWRFDMAWPDSRLAVECDGGTWTGGRHVNGAGYAKDCEKLNEAVLLGWRVLRVTSDQIFDGRAVRWIQRAMGHKNDEGV